MSKDPKFVTARHALQSIWCVGLAGEKQLQLILDCITERCEAGATEKHGTLIQFDMIQGLRELFDPVEIQSIKERVRALIEKEQDRKYQKNMQLNGKVHRKTARPGGGGR